MMLDVDVDENEGEDKRMNMATTRRYLFFFFLPLQILSRVFLYPSCLVYWFNKGTKTLHVHIGAAYCIGIIQIKLISSTGFADHYLKSDIATFSGIPLA